MRKTLLLALTLPALVHAQSRIDSVLVYPGGAQVERVLTVKAGAQTLELPCLPGSFDAQTLRMSGEGVQIGEINVTTVERAAAPECVNPGLEARIREVEDKRSQLQAEAGAQEAALTTLKNLGQSIGAAQIGSASEAVKTQAQAALLKKSQLQRGIDELGRQLAPLLAERKRWEQANPRLSRLTARISAAKEATLHLLYRSANAGWQPVYRAYLDSATGKVQLERRAEVAQSSGEDWSGVSLRLSTAQPNQAVAGPLPDAWLLQMQVEQQALARDVRSSSVMAMRAAPAPVAAKAAMLAQAPSFDVSVFEGEFATEFAVPARVNVAASGERVTLALGQTALDARVVARVDPQDAPQAFLVAEASRPAGVWPAGQAQMFRDGVFIGASYLSMPADGKLDLPFGRDEQIRVVVEPQTRNAGERGFIGSRVEQRISHAYRIESQHSKPFTVQVLEASPVSQHEDIKAEARFNPAPQPWREQPGVKVWEFTLAPNATQKLTADYTISYPKDMRVDGLR